MAKKTASKTEKPVDDFYLYGDEGSIRLRHNHVTRKGTDKKVTPIADIGLFDYLYRHADDLLDHIADPENDRNDFGYALYLNGCLAPFKMFGLGKRDAPAAQRSIVTHVGTFCRVKGEPAPHEAFGATVKHGSGSPRPIVDDPRRWPDIEESIHSLGKRHYLSPFPMGIPILGSDQQACLPAVYAVNRDGEVGYMTLTDFSSRGKTFGDSRTGKLNLDHLKLGERDNVLCPWQFMPEHEAGLKFRARLQLLDPWGKGDIKGHATAQIRVDADDKQKAFRFFPGGKISPRRVALWVAVDKELTDWRFVGLRKEFYDPPKKAIVVSGSREAAATDDEGSSGKKKAAPKKKTAKRKTAKTKATPEGKPESDAAEGLEIRPSTEVLGDGTEKNSAAPSKTPVSQRLAEKRGKKNGGDSKPTADAKTNGAAKATEKPNAEPQPAEADAAAEAAQAESES